MADQIVEDCACGARFIFIGVGGTTLLAKFREIHKDHWEVKKCSTPPSSSPSPATEEVATAASGSPSPPSS